MHRDHKIGLALGILLVGAVGALFFRHETVTRVDIPQLESPDRLDEVIANRERGPYLTESSKSPIVHEDAPLPAEFSDGFSEIAAEPIPIPPEQLTIPITETRQASNALPESDRTHLVKPGETLAGISHRYLGSEGRYRQILEANSNLLRDPKALKPGMKLRIPDRLTPPADSSIVKSAKPLRDPIQTASQPQEEAMPLPEAPVPPKLNSPESSRKFIPFRRPSKTGGGNSSGGNSSRTAEGANDLPSSVGGRRLSQLPPTESDPVVR